MAEIDVRAADAPGSFDVRLADGGGTSQHRVRVPDRAQAGLPHQADDTDLVRASFRFLLEREPAAAILKEFSLDEITRYFPEYPAEMQRRLG